MQFAMTEEQHSIRESVDRVCAEFDDDYWYERDRTATYPEEFHGAMAAGGWLGIAMPDAPITAISDSALIGQIVGIITGHMSLSQIKQTGEGGRGLGLAGVIIGWVTLGLAILGIILFIAWFGVIFANAREMGYSS